mmetsp:Transcript_14324/g.23713  ORF Transcript_14324/g.23713 Transcript_14324/m.23713 type:complete len:369 (-) Transcript_14324:451-1557(-)
MGTKFSYSSLSVEDQAQIPFFEAVGLREAEVGKLHAVYTRWINPSSNILSLNDLMYHLHSKITPFTRKIFDLEHANAMLDNVPFYKFALGLWNFCTLDDIDMVTYIFNMYDGEENGGEDDNESEGVLNMMTCKMMIKHLYGDVSHYESSPGSESCIALLSESKSDNEYVDVTFLKKFSRTCPAFLNPTLILKFHCIEVTTGSDFWNKKFQERKVAQNNSYVSKETLVKRASRRMINDEPAPQRDMKSEQRSGLKSLFGSGGGSSIQSPVARGVRHVGFQNNDFPASPSAGSAGGSGDDRSGVNQEGSSGPATAEDKSESVFDQISNLLYVVIERFLYSPLKVNFWMTLIAVISCIDVIVCQWKEETAI